MKLIESEAKREIMGDKQHEQEEQTWLSNISFESFNYSDKEIQYVFVARSDPNI